MSKIEALQWVRRGVVYMCLVVIASSFLAGGARSGFRGIPVLESDFVSTLQLHHARVVNRDLDGAETDAPDGVEDGGFREGRPVLARSCFLGQWRHFYNPDREYSIW
jgi:hypothetical protein